MIPMKLNLEKAHYLTATQRSLSSSKLKSFRLIQEDRASQNLAIISNIGLMNDFISRWKSEKYQNSKKLLQLPNQSQKNIMNNVPYSQMKGKFYTKKHIGDLTSSMKRAKEQALNHQLKQKMQQRSDKEFKEKLINNLKVKEKQDQIRENQVKRNLSTDVKQLLKNAIAFSKSSTKVNREDDGLSTPQFYQQGRLNEWKKLPFVQKIQFARDSVMDAQVARQNLISHQTKSIADGKLGLDSSFRRNPQQYGKANLTTTSVNNFKGKTQVLNALGFGNYWESDIKSLEIDFEHAKEYMKQWRIQDMNQLRKLLRFKIVQQVMKIEERKNIRKFLSSEKKAQIKRKAAESAAKLAKF